jgi:flagellar motor switch protein FliN/FliY
MSLLANDIELEPMIEAPSDTPLLSGSWPFLNAVKVRVSVRVGEAHTTVGELLDLKQGAVLPLDRLVDESMDIIVEGHVVARGMLVAIGDHFGVRITETVNLAGNNT